jgi:diguanylate cyclase (GGDEF)-like protein
MNIQKKLTELEKKYEEVETTNQTLSNKLSELFVLYNLTRILATTFDLNKVLQNIFQLFQKSLSIDFSSLILAETFASELILDRYYGSSMKEIVPVLLPNEKMHDRIMKKRQLEVRTIGSAEEIVLKKPKRLSFPLQYLGYPVTISNQKTIGSLSFFKVDPVSFSEENIDFYRRITQEVSNILDKVFLYYQTREDTFRDHLTGVYNRRYFNQRLEMEVKRADRYNRDLSILMIDIDNFKQINDQFGHITGDKILKKLAVILGKNLRTSDILVRFGGEEFVALLPETNSHNAYMAAEKLRTSVEDYLYVPLKAKKNNQKVTISIGVSNYPQDADSTISLINQADQRLYLAKSKGKNCTIKSDIE